VDEIPLQKRKDEMIHECPTSKLQRLTIVVALLFGLLTLFAGGRVLLGADAGHVVVMPLLLFNTLMGAAYVGAAILLRRDLRLGRTAAGIIALLNLLALASLLLYARDGGLVAADSFRAMTLRTGVWAALFAAAGWVLRRQRRALHPGIAQPG
jgi:hypothetical protein